MKEKINSFRKQTDEIIALCVEELKGKGPNIDILKAIKKEFEEIKDCISEEGKIRVLNSRRQLLSSRVINDCADFDYNQELFSKIAEFSDECQKIPKKYLKILFDY